jgi:small GTP-binding protein
MGTPRWALSKIKSNTNYLDLTYYPSEHKGEFITDFPREILSYAHITALNLSNNKLRTLPEDIYKLRNLVYLNLAGNQLRTLPNTILELKALKQLNLSGNPNLVLPNNFSLPEELSFLNLNATNIYPLLSSLRTLTKLTTLSLAGTGLTFLPKEITEIQSLSVLNLISNSLSTLPDEIGDLENLVELNLNSNQISALPKTMHQLERLQKLYISNNRLTNFPEVITTIKSLKFLHIGNNNITDIPESIENLTSLTELNLAYCPLKTLPDSIGDLEELKSLNLRKTQVKHLPKTITELDNLIYLEILDTKLITPPVEVAQKGIKEIKEYFRQLRGGQDHLYEAKLLILGEGGAGKTTLANKILNENYQLREEISTEGVDVKQWLFPLENGDQFRVNIWDFGGQEIYHATHQYFLTKRSLYVLVADTRKEDTDFYYWLNVVDLLSDGSPLIIIKNEKQNRHREINERQLRGQFENLKDILSTNLATNRGMLDVKNSIKHYIRSLPHIGSPLPKTWVRVREKLEGDARNYISLEEYIKMCKDNGFTEVKDSLQLSGYLHDIGVFLHFQDDPLLNKIVILKPKWGTDAAYKVLDNKQVIRNLGQFAHGDLAGIWSASQYTGMHNELLQLMRKFKLCYEIPNKKGVYLAPQLLSENQPQYSWDDKDNLLLRYAYEFMPKGILTQFIVSMNQYILNTKNQSLVWKSGLIIEKDNSIGEIVEFYGKRQIQIRVRGAHKRELLTIIMYQLDQIHNTYNRLKYDKLIPCNCSDCKSSQEPFFYRHEQLQNFVEKKLNEIQCGKSGIMVPVRNLIDDVIFGEYLKKVQVDDAIPQIHITVGNNSSIGSIVLDSTIQNSLNKVSNADISDELKTTLKELAQAVNEMNNSLPQEKATETADDLDRLIDEATKQLPNKKWYSVSIDGLIKAAENLDKLGEPVVNLSRKVFSLLSGGILR